MSNSWLAKLVGVWAGDCSTWFEPGVLADQSRLRGEFRSILGGRFLRHAYEGSIQGKPRIGEETIVFNEAVGQFQVAWIDDFHSSGAIMLSQGAATETGFAVSGSYDVGPGLPPWGWKTVYDLASPNQLTITAYNVTPDGQEAKAVEIVYGKASA